MMMSDFIGAIEFMDPSTPIEKLCQEKKIMEVFTLHLRAIMSALKRLLGSENGPFYTENYYFRWCL